MVVVGVVGLTIVVVMVMAVVVIVWAGSLGRRTQWKEQGHDQSKEQWRARRWRR